MIISDRTVSLLKNFCGINGSIVLKPGKLIQTLSDDKMVYVEATISEDFPLEFGVYRLKEFIGLLTLNPKFAPDLTFEEDHCSIKSGSMTVKYVYDDKSFIHTPKGRPKETTPVTAMSISWDELKLAMGTASTLKYSYLWLEIEAGIAKFTTKDHTQHKTESTAMAFPVSFKGGFKPEDDLEVNFALRIDHLKKLLHMNYDIFVYEDRRVMFISPEGDIQYHMVVTKDSYVRKKDD